jgi:hypothetical protein
MGTPSIKELKDVTISPTAESETRYVTAVLILFKDISINKAGWIYVVDTPGFEDTGGAEIDISNGIGSVEALKGCKNGRTVILFSY